MRRYPYVGSRSVRARALEEPAGAFVRTRSELAAWIARHPESLREGATFVVDLDGVLRLAPRRSEHVACAEGRDVRSAGEITFASPSEGLAVREVSNQSTGYCPEPESFEAVAAALDGIGVARPAEWTHAFVFRRCARCAQLALVKDGVYECAVCGAPLPIERNV